MDKQLITAAFEKLGPEKVARMLPAFTPENRGTWDCCALAHLYGMPGALRQRLNASGVSARAIASLVGLEVEQAMEISVTHHWPEPRAMLRGMIEEWLELNRVPEPVSAGT